MQFLARFFTATVVTLLTLLVISVLSAWLGYRFGKDNCRECMEVTSQPRFRKEHIKPILELALVYRNNQEKTQMELPPDSEFAQWLAHQFSRLGMNRTARYEFLYNVNYRYGVDLDRNPWSVRISPQNRVLLTLPEVELTGCPAIDTGSIVIDIRQTSLFVLGEKDRIPALMKRLTEESMRAGESYLQANRDTVTALVQTKARKLMRAISLAYGLEVDASGIDITHQPVNHGELSMSEKLQYYGCTVR